VNPRAQARELPVSEEQQPVWRQVLPAPRSTELRLVSPGSRAGQLLGELNFPRVEKVC